MVERVESSEPSCEAPKWRIPAGPTEVGSMTPPSFDEARTRIVPALRVAQADRRAVDVRGWGDWTPPDEVPRTRTVRRLARSVNGARLHAPYPTPSRLWWVVWLVGCASLGAASAAAWILWLRG